ncbi:nucleotidyltransferase family protein [Geobacter pickeringii]|uniref:Nucleotidyltransferase n=1 Tax=Geobacter pickeringii TaxID=345632 RepID=A0A0B5BBK3_9BACT|nr:hypothetical protein [Geobacter pickeringii]AJE04158.1 hypothetical protein GPICK_13025 [Geobacter pickeringii]
MSRTVNRGFNELLHRVTPTHTEAESSKTLHLSLANLLRSGYGLNDFVITGSLHNGTCITGCSDYDYFAVIPTNRLKADSAATVSEIKNYLDFHLHHGEVSEQVPGVRVAFGVGAKDVTVVIPADMVAEANGCRVYEMPNPAGGWMRTSPEAHGAYLKTLEQRLGPGVRNLIRLMKAWKYSAGVSISSFYLELVTAKYLEGVSSVVYDVDMHGILSHLFNTEMAPIQDPTGVSGHVPPCTAHSDFVAVKEELTLAFIRANKALEARLHYNVAEAFDWWHLVYNGKFLKYFE